jgi:transposase-like protein
MPRGPRAVPLHLTDAERAELRRLLRRRGVGQALAQRIRVVLACAEPGATNLGVAGALGVSRPAVATWRGRFAEHRLEGLARALRRAPAGRAGAGASPSTGWKGWRTRSGAGRRAPSATRRWSAWSP